MTGWVKKEKKDRRKREESTSDMQMHGWDGASQTGQTAGQCPTDRVPLLDDQRQALIICIIKTAIIKKKNPSKHLRSRMINQSTNKMTLSHCHHILKMSLNSVQSLFLVFVKNK